jgi:3-hydroxybutyryl-CoA dehydrogenase
MHEVTTVGIVGSGTMASGLAELTARAGFTTVVRTRRESAADEVLGSIGTRLGKQVAKGSLSEADRDATLARLSAGTGYEALSHCDLVIESVVEDIRVKRDVFGELDDVVQPDAILASNTSTFPVVELAMVTKRPDLVCGLHFFNPAPVMRLVEVVRPITASEATIERVTAFAEACGKDVVHVKDEAGFVVNALLFPYLNSAVRLAERGTASVADIDTAMRGGCNFPMGPFALLDLVGLDTSVAILEALQAEFGEPSYTPAPLLRRLVAAGRLGRKTQHGFFAYA